MKLNFYFLARKRNLFFLLFITMFIVFGGMSVEETDSLERALRPPLEGGADG